MKEIFDWLREQFEEKSVQGFDGNGNPVNVRFVASIMAEDIITEAEAKWEADCCEWKPIDDDFLEYRSNCDRISAVNSYWKVCPFCGKPIKIVEVE